MVHIFAGLQGSGKTKRLIDAMHETLKNESGSLVCIEKGNTMRFNLDYRVRLIDSGEYAIDNYTFLKGFISGLHAGNFDICHIFIDNLCKVANSKDEAELEAFLSWCEKFSEANGVSFTFTLSRDVENMPEYLNKYI